MFALTEENFSKANPAHLLCLPVYESFMTMVDSTETKWRVNVSCDDAINAYAASCRNKTEAEFYARRMYREYTRCNPGIMFRAVIGHADQDIIICP